MSNLLVTKNLSKKFVKKKALDNVNLEIGKGKVIGLLGENGARKNYFN